MTRSKTGPSPDGTLRAELSRRVAAREEAATQADDRAEAAARQRDTLTERRAVID